MSTRSRLIARYLLLAVLLLVLFAAVFATWLLRSGGGRDFALARVLAALPAESLSWERAEGTISGPLTLHGVRYSSDGLIIEMERVVVDLAPTELFDDRLHIEALTLDNGRIELPAGEETNEPFALPDALPSISLPVSVTLDSLLARNVRVTQAGVDVADVQRLELVGTLEQGRVALQKLEIDSSLGSLRAKGDLDTAKRWESGLQASVDLAGVGDTPLPMTVVLTGDADNFTLDVSAQLPEPATLKVTGTGGLSKLRWTAQLNAPRVDPARFGAEGEVLALSLQADGDLQEAHLAGDVKRGDLSLRIEPSTLRYRDGVAELAPLALAVAEGTVTATGTVDLTPEAALLALDLAWSELRSPSTDGAVVVTSSGQARIDGPLTDYALTLDGSVQRGTETAQIELRGRGSRERLQFESLSMQTPRGALDAEGSLAWEPQLAWDVTAELHGFDPGFLAPDFPGAVDATLVSQGTLVDGEPQGALVLDPLGGELRGRGLGGRIDAKMNPDRSGEGEIDLRIGDSHVSGSGTWSDTLDARLQFDPLELADVLPDLAGQLRGTLVLAGPRERPAIDADLQGTALAVPGFTAETLSLRARIEEFANGSLSVEAQQVALAGQTFGTLSLSGEGSRDAHEITLALGDGVAGIALELAGAENAGAWKGTLRSLRIEPRERAAWTLRAPATLAYDFKTGALVLDEACLAESQSSLCVDADWQARAGSARFTLEQVPLATLDPFLADAFGAPVSAEGVLSAQGSMQRSADGVLTGSLQAQSPRGGLRFEADTERELLVYDALAVQGTLDNTSLRIEANAGLAAGGSVSARLVSLQALQDDGALEGRIEARVRDLTFLELLSDELVDPKGTLDANLTIAGTRKSPSLAGDATLAGFAAELPALGLALTEGEIALRSRGTQAADIRGQVRSGQGTLKVEGAYDAAPEADETLALTLKGDTITVAGLPELTAAASPDLTLRLKGDKLRLRGSVDVPLARIELERLQSATRPSSDVVIVDAGGTEADAGIALDSDITVKLGDDVRLNGFGLKGKLTGQVGVRDRPGRATVARGGVEVTGEYKAYGQDLKITRGRLAYASTPVDNPSLDIRAQREIDEITVGVQVRGTALAPELTLWSNPSLDQAEQLSYLVLGRPLRSASQTDGAQLTQAAAAIGGNLLAKRLGARMGLDEVGVADNRALGGAALTVGKYLSPKLYVSYGVALFGSGQVVTFKYLLSRVWSVQIDSGTENRAAVNYRLER